MIKNNLLCPEPPERVGRKRIYFGWQMTEVESPTEKPSLVDLPEWMVGGSTPPPGTIYLFS